jgi:hypothetical protein
MRLIRWIIALFRSAMPDENDPKEAEWQADR